MMGSRFASMLKHAVVAGAVMFGLSAAASAQNWPSRNITVVVPYAAGGGADFVMRLIADDLTKRLGWSIVIDNRGGANGTLGAAAVARAAPDGHTFMIVPSGPVVNAKLLSEGLTYNPDTDFTPVMKVVFVPNGVIVGKDVPAKTLKEFVAYAKANPGKINAGTSGSNSTQDLLSIMFAAGTGVEIAQVPYKGTGQMLPDLVGNRLQVIFDALGPYLALAKSGDVRILATHNPTRLETLPDVPTIVESGFTEVPTWQTWFGIFGPKGLPEDIRARFANEVAAYLNTPAAKEKLAGAGYVAMPEGADVIRSLMQRETEALTKVIEKFGIKKQPL